MKALIFENRVVDIAIEPFLVVKTMQWVDAPDGVVVGYTCDGENFIPPIVVEPSIEEVRENKLQELEKQYNIVRASTYVAYNGNQFGISKDTIGDINALWSVGQKKESEDNPLPAYPFTDKDGVRVAMTKEQFSLLIDNAFLAVAGLDARQAEIRAEIQALQSVSEINNYNISF